MDNQRNLIVAVLLCGLLLLGYDAAMRFFYPQAMAPIAASPPADTPAERAAVRTPGIDTPGQANRQVDLATALSAPVRVPVEAPRITGSVNAQGAQIDDITLVDHRQSIARDSSPVRLFAPANSPVQQFARLGFLVNGQVATGADTLWERSGGPLAPGSPVVLTHRGAQGEVFTIRFSVDENYMITAEQTVANGGAAAIVTQPFAAITRTSATATPDIWNIHSGPIGAFGGVVSYAVEYDDLGRGAVNVPAGRPDWIGFTDQYWLSALVPDPRARVEGSFRGLGDSLFRADLIYQPQTLPPGQQLTVTTRVFVGAKESRVLEAYERTLGIAQFDKAIDWGWFYWFMKPILWLLLWLFELVGNFGVAIILLTVLVRGLMFPIAQKQFASMAAMRALQPRMKALQERYKDDKPKMQQELLALYRDEKVNPLAGCLPILIQIPIFFALYKVLLLAVEMRHQPFVLWIRDLSAPDPAHILNLFGLLPFEVPTLLAIGPLAVLLGVTMWLTFRLNPTAMDPVQQQVFSIMPWVLMFVMAPFSAGLLLYWVTSNILTVAQQSYLYSRHPQLKAAAEKERLEKEKASARARQEST
ncbi:membrane protein insertase YidC [Erythrobacteraceae bacterium CFH 75059]|uniref:membrane protein insertase YidC n=1 Tax=Qipengyuania thermophila TaxID=2509361 RepID=UPI00101FFC8B|nr:membrane protein insertase YidC [Qipengyuania thermophila]TCD01928.1 membrane protein insertase YidC [Erythrobacteraceae bacterium CFH 75059]